MAQIVEPEVSNLGSCEYILEAPFQSLPSTLVTPCWREDAIFTDHRRYRRISSASSDVIGT